MEFLPYKLATASIYSNSSAPSFTYFLAAAFGSPRTLTPSNLIPFISLLPLTSKRAIILLQKFIRIKRRKVIFLRVC